MRLLITRPEEDGEALSKRLLAAGHEAILAPVMEIVAVDARLELEGVQALLVTSRNGARMLARATPRRDLPVYAVGDQSAAEAKADGFAIVTSAAGNVAALATLVARSIDPKRGPLLHGAGSAQAGDLAQMLAAKGFTVRRTILYESRAKKALPDAAQRALKTGYVEGVLFYSPRTARVFGELAQEAGLGAGLGSLTAYCLSEAVAEAASPFAYKAYRVAKTPNEATLLALI